MGRAKDSGLQRSQAPLSEYRQVAALDIEGLPEKALDLIDWREVNTENGRIVEKFKPWGVHVYRIIPD